MYEYDGIWDLGDNRIQTKQCSLSENDIKNMAKDAITHCMTDDDAIDFYGLYGRFEDAFRFWYDMYSNESNEYWYYMYLNGLVL